MGVGFQLNMIDGETSLSAGFPGDAEERAVPRDKYFCSLFVCADMPDACTFPRRTAPAVSKSLDISGNVYEFVRLAYVLQRRQRDDIQTLDW